MAKKTKEELLEKQKALKEELRAAKDERRSFEKENKLAKAEDHSKDEKHGKKWTKLNDVVVSKQEALDKVTASLDELKAEGKTSRTQYEYPKEMTDPAERKKYRAKMRAAKKKEAKGEGEGKESKKGKEEKGEKSEKKSKKEKKVKEAAAEAED